MDAKVKECKNMNFHGFFSGVVLSGENEDVRIPVYFTSVYDLPSDTTVVEWDGDIK